MIQKAKNNHQSGQVAIVILLIMVVLLTVGLSLASRTTQELFLSQQEAESARVFNAAEVGVEEALSQDFSTITGTVTLPSSTVVDDVTTSTTIQSVNTLETQIVEGAAVHLNLTGYGGTSFSLNWARETACNTDVNNPGAASILVSIYYRDGTTPKVVHEAYSPCTRFSDQFTLVTTDPSGAYFRQTSVPVPNGGSLTPLFARIRAVYNDTALRVTGTGLTQFYVIRSQANTDIGEESRTVEVGRTLSGAPSFMDYSVYSGSDITIESVP